MAIEHIMEGVGGIPPAQKGYLDSKRKVESKPGEKVEQNRNDQVSISSDAKKLVSQENLISQVKELLVKLPDVRQEKIEEALAKVYGGVFEQHEVAQKVVEFLLKGDGLNARSTASQSVSDTIREERVAEANKKLQSGYYDQATVLKGIVDRLLD
jgi:hypothetical protein